MYRPFIIAVAALALTAPIARSQSTSAERERQRAEQERDREQAQRDRDQAQRDAAQAKRDVDRERRDRERDRRRDLDREERSRAGSLDTTVAFDARGTLSVACPGGAVIVTGSDRNEIRVRARTESGGIRFTSAASRAVLETTSGRGCSDGRFEVSVPVGTRVIANSWSGSVSVRGVRGEVEAHVQSGSVEVRDATRLEIEALSGDVNVQGARGDVGIRSISGDVRLSDVHGDVEVESVSGDVDLAQIVAKQVRAHTTSGEIAFGGQILDAGRYEFNTHSGEVHLNLPPDFGAELSISTFNGAIESDFPITLKAGEHGIGASQSKRINFTVGRGSARIIAETFSGEITLSTKGRR